MSVSACKDDTVNATQVTVHSQGYIWSVERFAAFHKSFLLAVTPGLYRRTFQDEAVHLGLPCHIVCKMSHQRFVVKCALRSHHTVCSETKSMSTGKYCEHIQMHISHAHSVRCQERRVLRDVSAGCGPSTRHARSLCTLQTDVMLLFTCCT